MKVVLSCLLTFALLVHGAVAVAMVPAMSAAEPAAEMEGMEGMPCHQGEHAKAKPCCQSETCAYQVFCSGVVVHAALPVLRHVQPVAQRFAPFTAEARTAHRLSLLRPPIRISA